MRAFDSKKETYLKLLLYGLPGSLKTRTSATAAWDERSSPSLMLEAGGNPISLSDYEKRPDIIHMETLEDFNLPYNWLAAGQNPDDPFCKKFGLQPPYKSLIIDSITETQRMSFNTVTGSTNVGPGSFSQRVQRQHFGQVLSQMINLAKLFYALPMHVILTSLEKANKDEITGSITYAPLLWGQSDTEVGGYAYAVGRMCHRAALPAKTIKIVEDASEGEITAVALFKPSGKYVAKDQYGKFGDYMVDPSIPKMLDLIYGGS